MEPIKVIKKLNAETKAEVYFTGGFVRDLLRNKENKNIDVVVRNLSYRKIKEYLKNYGIVKEVSFPKTEKAYFTNFLIFKMKANGPYVRVTMPIRNKKHIPSPNNTLKQDVRLRDFKMNALYLAVDKQDKKDIIDLVGGKEDIVKKKITPNGNADDKIKESPIRMLRAISLAANTGYTINKEIVNAIKENSTLIIKCSAERIRKELNTIFMSDNPSRYITIMKTTGLLQYIIPELYKCIGVKQDPKYHKYDVFNHLLQTLDHCPKDLTIRLAGLLHDTGKPDTYREIIKHEELKITFYKHDVVGVNTAKTFLQRLGYDSKTTKDVLHLIRHHMFHYTDDWTEATVRRFIKKVKISEEYLTESNIKNFPLFQLRAAERLAYGLGSVARNRTQEQFESKILKIYKETISQKKDELRVNREMLESIFNINNSKTDKVINYLVKKVYEEPELNDTKSLLALTADYLYDTQQQI